MGHGCCSLGLCFLCHTGLSIYKVHIDSIFKTPGGNFVVVCAVHLIVLFSSKDSFSSKDFLMKVFVIIVIISSMSSVDEATLNQKDTACSCSRIYFWYKACINNHGTISRITTACMPAIYCTPHGLTYKPTTSPCLFSFNHFCLCILVQNNGCQCSSIQMSH